MSFKASTGEDMQQTELRKIRHSIEMSEKLRSCAMEKIGSIDDKDTLEPIEEQSRRVYVDLIEFIDQQLIEDKLTEKKVIEKVEVLCGSKRHAPEGASDEPREKLKKHEHSSSSESALDKLKKKILAEIDSMCESLGIENGKFLRAIIKFIQEVSSGVLTAEIDFTSLLITNPDLFTACMNELKTEICHLHDASAPTSASTSTLRDLLEAVQSKLGTFMQKRFEDAENQRKREEELAADIAPLDFSLLLEFVCDCLSPEKQMQLLEEVVAIIDAQPEDVERRVKPALQTDLSTDLSAFDDLHARMIEHKLREVEQTISSTSILKQLKDRASTTLKIRKLLL